MDDSFLLAPGAFARRRVQYVLNDIGRRVFGVAHAGKVFPRGAIGAHEYRNITTQYPRHEAVPIVEISKGNAFDSVSATYDRSAKTNYQRIVPAQVERSIKSVPRNKCPLT